MYADILVEVNTLEKTFTYKIPDGINAEVGMRALVPFGNRKVEGFIMRIYNDGNFDYEVKEIFSLIDDYPVINKEMLELGKYISKKNLSTLISAYQAMLPLALKAKNKVSINRKYNIYLEAICDSNIKTLKQKEVYDFIKEKGLVLKSEISSKSILKTLLDNGNLKEVKKEAYRLEEHISFKL